MQGPRKSADRLLLWIDAVGGYLTCLGDTIVLGQASPDSPADVPILADVSRRHAVLRREGDAYSITPLATTTLDDAPIQRTASLVDGAVIQLGDGVRIRFRQPNALSATARLEFESRHRTLPRADAVLLLATACVLGPKLSSHVVCRDWLDDVILYRDAGRLYCRSERGVRIDGVAHRRRGLLSGDAQATGDDFSLRLEYI